MNSTRLTTDFFSRDVLEVAPELLGSILVRKFESGEMAKYVITEVEAYRGAEDLACHASKGRTTRTEVMFSQGGHLYIYLIYGVHWMLNVVTGKENEPQAVLVRGVENCIGPGRLTRYLKIDKSFYGEDICQSQRIWLEKTTIEYSYKTGPRIGVDYAGDHWASMPWRFWLDGYGVPEKLTANKQPYRL